MEVVYLNRIKAEKVQTLGEMIYKGKVVAKTIELPWLDNNKRISIPIVIQDRYLCIYSDRMSSNQSNSEFNIAGLRK